MTSSAPVTDALLGILADASAELVKRRAEEIADTKTGVPHNLPVSAGVLVLLAGWIARLTMGERERVA